MCYTGNHFQYILTTSCTKMPMLPTFCVLRENSGCAIGCFPGCNNINYKQECIPRRMRTGRSLTVCCSLLPGDWGVSLVRGVICAWSGGVSAPGGWGGGSRHLVWGGGGVPGPGGPGHRGGCAWSGGCIPACTEADTLPPWMRILDARLRQYYLGPTSLLPVTSPLTPPNTPTPNPVA